MKKSFIFQNSFFVVVVVQTYSKEIDAQLEAIQYVQLAQLDGFK